MTPCQKPFFSFFDLGQVGNSQFLINETYIYSVRRMELGSFQTAYHRATQGLASCCGYTRHADASTEHTVIRREDIVLVHTQTEQKGSVTSQSCGCSCPTLGECCACCYTPPLVSVSYSQKEPLDVFLRTKEVPVTIQVDANQVENVLQIIMSDVKGTAMIA